MKMICNGSMSVEEREAKIAEAIRLRTECGMGVREIAEKVGCDRTTVYKWFKSNRIPVGVGRRKYDYDLIDRIGEMYQTMSRAKIAKELNIDYPCVQYIINAYYIRKDDEM